MVIKELLYNTIQYLRESGNDNPIFEAHCLVRHAFSLSATELVLMHDKTADPKKAEFLSSLTARRVSGEPLQYILGTQEFMSLEFAVTEDVLIPRPDTETLTEYVIEHMKNRGFSLLDIGTGTGCIPLSIAYYNKRTYVRGVDISEKAVKIAESNSEKLRLSERAAFEKLDILTEIPCGKYDIITSNPPYIESDVIESLDTCVKDFEPRLALDGGADGLVFYRRICDIAPLILNPGGMLIFEIGYNQGVSVSKLMQKSFRDVEVIKDLCENDRVAVGFLKQLS